MSGCVDVSDVITCTHTHTRKCMYCVHTGSIGIGCIDVSAAIAYMIAVKDESEVCAEVCMYVISVGSCLHTHTRMHESTQMALVHTSSQISSYMVSKVLKSKLLDYVDEQTVCIHACMCACLYTALL